MLLAPISKKENAMTEILAPIDAAAKLCGQQKVKAGVNYRMTHHCVEAACDEGRLLYHTLLGSICLIPSGGEEEAREELIRRWYLVPEAFDENSFADEVRKVASLIKPKAQHKDHFTILTTTDCNARCRYCYELGRKRVSMTRETAEAAAEYMIRQSGGDRPLRLFWFGGEPLYNIPAIETITGILNDRGIAFHSGTTSNGFYLTPDVLRKAREDWHLENAQITIDGTQGVYNRVKAYIDDCENPFERVLSNIDAALASGMRILIRLNMDRNNAADISDAIDELCGRFHGKGNCKIYVALLRSYKSKVAAFDSEQEQLACYFALREKIKGYGMLRIPPLSRQLKLNRCKADNDTCEIILPDGQLDRCHHYTEGEQVGSIFREDRDQAMIDAWKEIQKDYQACKTCPAYPVCLNLKKCDWNKDGCTQTDRAIHRRSLEDQILQHYERAKTNQAGL